MYYLHISTSPQAAPQMRPHATLYGPFASEQEAAGYVRKLTLWYPQGMQQVQFEIQHQHDATQRRRKRVVH